MANNEFPVTKSEVLFLYESTYSVPNGDPFTGEQRYDEETKRILVSDVRIKRFIRDYFIDNGVDVFVRNDRSNVKAASEGDAESGSAARFNTLEANAKKGASAQEILTELIDVRLFGGISTKAKNAINLTGPVQFALLNPSLNAVDLRMHQNTSVFASSTEKSRGAIGTTTVVPYSLNQIHGWVNPYAARDTKLTSKDVDDMLCALWNSINNANTRSKSNQSSLLLLQLVYTEPSKKLYGLDRTIKIVPCADKREEQLRSRHDYALDLSALKSLVSRSQMVSAANFYTEDLSLRNELSNSDKFQELKIV
ncbi:MAG: type I-B CRISPR-associated protein Cas7/Csh2 [Capsulimonadaceae bacterium]|nr:type I-B CRISPR-associated protein Cas7/Csh2 [Capsulimonadaceae bacterium]